MAIVIETVDTEENKGTPLWEIQFDDAELAWLRASGVDIEEWLESAIAQRFAMHGQTFNVEPPPFGKGWIDPFKGGGSA